MEPLLLYSGFFVQIISFPIEKNQIHLMIEKIV